jgi:cystinosin
MVNDIDETPLIAGGGEQFEQRLSSAKGSRRTLWHACGLAGFILTTALFLAGFLPPQAGLRGPVYPFISATIGWSYFICWSLSFWPQIFLNFGRKTTVGLSFDYTVLNAMGFLCYSAFNIGRYGSSGSQVRINDVAFSVHALAVTLLTIIQILWYDWRKKRQRTSRATLILLATLSGVAGIWAILTATLDVGPPLTWTGLLFVVSYFKIGISVLKYLPQVVLNYKRRSTVGWSMLNVTLDCSGGILSVLQLVLDCANTGDWHGIVGTPAKFALGFVSIFFDLIFFIQHYVLYRGAAPISDDFMPNEDDEDLRSFLEFGGNTPHGDDKGTYV